MMGILNYVQYCLKKIPPKAKEYAVLLDAESETKRCIDIVQNLLTFSRLDKDEKTTDSYTHIQFSLVLDRVLRLLGYRIEKEGVKITQNIAKNSIQVHIDPTILQQIFLNFITNSLDAMKDSSKKEIHFNVRSSGKFVQIDISDTGSGIPEKNISRIFDPFFTTKSPGRGTGLGLSVSHSLVRSQGGKIICESEPGKGTTFHIMIPLKNKE
jgi:two-component system NtrC family sensor kinase